MRCRDISLCSRCDDRCISCESVPPLAVSALLSRRTAHDLSGVTALAGILVIPDTHPRHHATNATNMTHTWRCCRAASCALWVAAVAVVIAVSFTYPLYTAADDDSMVAQLHALQDTEASTPNKHDVLASLTLLSFNVRLDALEANPEHHFTKRVSRLGTTFARLQPTLVGLQEPFAGQLLHMKRYLPEKYVPVGYDRFGESAAGKGPGNLALRSRHDDFKIGMLYDSEVGKGRCQRMPRGGTCLTACTTAAIAATGVNAGGAGVLLAVAHPTPREVPELG